MLTAGTVLYLSLQWGLGLSTEERSRILRELADKIDASMGPRSFNRGKAAGAGRIGPRAIGLQWGLGLSTEERARDARRHDQNERGFNGASVFQPRKGPSPKKLTEPACSSFNGASVFQPRKGLREIHCRGLDPLASMGPRSFNRGKLADRAEADRDAQRFNGASVFQPRKASRG